MEIDYKLIGKRIRHRRRMLDYSQEQLAVMTGLSKTHISNVENAHSIPSVETIIAISQALEITPDCILLGVDRGKEENDALRQYFDWLLLCSNRDREIVCGIVDMMIEKDGKAPNKP